MDWLTGEFNFGMLSLVALLFVFGSHVVRERPELQRFGKRLAMLAFFVVAIWYWYLWQPSEADEVVGLLLRSLALSGLVLGSAWLVLPSLAFLRDVTIRPVQRAWREHRQRRRQRREAITQRIADEIERRRREADWQRTAPEREQARRDAEAQAQAVAANRTRDKHRREEARLSCLLLRDQYSTELGSRFTRERLEEYFATYMTDSHAPEEVESRATQLRGMIEEALTVSGVNRKKRFQSLDEIAKYFQQLREAAKRANYDPDTLDSIESLYATAETKALEEFFKS